MTPQEFVEKYEIGVSFEEMYTIRENIKSKLKFANSFLLGDVKKGKYTKEQENYLEVGPLQPRYREYSSPNSEIHRQNVVLLVSYTLFQSLFLSVALLI